MTEDSATATDQIAILRMDEEGPDSRETFDIETASKEALVEYASEHLGLKLDRTRRIDLLRGQVRNAPEKKNGARALILEPQPQNGVCVRGDAVTAQVR